MTYNEKREINCAIMECKDNLMDIVRKLAPDDSTYRAFKKLLNADDLLSDAMREINKLK